MRNRKVKIDKKDRRIIYELENNCRRSLNKIAKKVGLSKQALHYRIERLVREGAIIQFIANIDYSKLGYVNHEVWLQFNEITKEQKEEFINFLKNHPNIRWLASCGGKFDLAMAIMAKDVIFFSEILNQILGRYNGYVQNHFITISKGVWTYPRSYLINDKENRNQGHLLFGGALKTQHLDEKELKILHLLSKNAKLSTVEIAQKVGLTPITIRTKIRQFEKEGIIVGYKAIIQPAAIGIENYEVLITTQNVSEDKMKGFQTYCQLNPYITFLLKIVGRWDLNISFDAENGEHFQQMMIEIRSRFGSIIRDYEYVPILWVYKFDFAPVNECKGN
ncbi:MAG: Lrp/AsnC family transcriptional regulator [Candidatus Micrarchaeota archaeon]